MYCVIFKGEMIISIALIFISNIQFSQNKKKIIEQKYIIVY